MVTIEGRIVGAAIAFILIAGGVTGAAAAGGASTATIETDDTSAAAVKEPSSVEPTPLAEISGRWGIEIVSLRRTAAETLIDFRYRIVDPDKAVFMVDRTIDAYLIDQKSGMVVGVPNTAKVGPLRQTTKYGKPPEDKVFFMLFSNPGRTIEAGNKVTIQIGDFKVTDLIVE